MHTLNKQEQHLPAFCMNAAIKCIKTQHMPDTKRSPFLRHLVHVPFCAMSQDSRMNPLIGTANLIVTVTKLLT